MRYTLVFFIIDDDEHFLKRTHFLLQSLCNKAEVMLSAETLTKIFEI